MFRFLFYLNVFYFNIVSSQILSNYTPPNSDHQRECEILGKWFPAPFITTLADPCQAIICGNDGSKVTFWCEPPISTPCETILYPNFVYPACCPKNDCSSSDDNSTFSTSSLMPPQL